MANKKPTNKAKAALSKAKEALAYAEWTLSDSPKKHTVQTMLGKKVTVKEVAPGVLTTDGVGYWGEKPDDAAKLKMYENADAILSVKAAKKARLTSQAQSQKASKPRAKRAATITVSKRDWRSVSADLINKTVRQYLKDGYSVTESKERAAEELKCSSSQIRDKYKPTKRT